MSLLQIRINGIRLGSGLNQILQTSVGGDAVLRPQLYHTLAENKTNIICLGLWIDAAGTSGFCCHDNSDVKPDIKYSGQPNAQSINLDHISNVSMVSVYPHHASLNTLGFLIQLFGENKIMFQQMISSNAMLSFVIKGSDQEKVVAFLEHKFDLPPTHTPFQQNFNDETSAFVKKRYPETSATYVEEKIKTYGIQMNANLLMHEISFNPGQQEHLVRCGKGLQNLSNSLEKFYFTAAMTQSKDVGRLFFLTDPVPDQSVSGMDICRSMPVDLITFHGPHFGDRFGIFNTAMECLKAASIKVLLAGCTGASICMVLPATLGEKAVSALFRGFETP